MAIIKASDLNANNTAVYTIGSKAQILSSLANNNLDALGKNDVSVGDEIVPIEMDNLQKAINILESKFSNNCCQSDCNTFSTISSCQVCQTQTSVCQSQKCQSCQRCQTCQGCQTMSCQSTSCQSNCHSNCSNCSSNCNCSNCSM